ncbi:MAG: pre-toxin TG domain-containing protein, partial [Moraxellaceae bacterium]|nr:pre-toxin TG domain-containing protein [Moraxellaceae bacterium]
VAVAGGYVDSPNAGLTLEITYNANERTLPESVVTASATGKGGGLLNWLSKPENISFVLDMVPVVGTLKSLYQAGAGRDLITGESVNRWVEGAGIVAGMIPGGKLGVKGAVGAVSKSVPSSYYDDLARQATRNPDSNKVVLGKFIEDGKSYTKVGAHYEASYFKLDNWRDINKSLDDIWPINEAFLDRQIRAGKEIILSHDPAKATGYFKREVNYLNDLGYKFEQDNWIWKAIR